MAIVQKKTLKERALDWSHVEEIASLFCSTWDQFAHDTFISSINEGFDEASILQRVRIISRALAKQLPSDYSKTTQILLSALEDSPGPTSLFGDFIYAPFNDVVALLGCTPEHYDKSLDTLREMTVYFSSELALRPFFGRFVNETFDSAEQWTRDPREQVRRLASESTRPFLPWASKISLPLKQRIQFLDQLKNDKSEFVLQSVGNHLDDIAKQDPGRAVQIISDWQSGNWRQSSARIIVKHATRSLLRSGDKRVFPLLGLRVEPELRRFSARLSARSVTIGGPLLLCIAGETCNNERLYVDMELRYPSAKPGKVNMRVFKLRTFDAEAHKPFSFERAVKTTSTSTRRYRSGACTVTIRLNGTVRQILNFDLKV